MPLIECLVNNNELRLIGIESSLSVGAAMESVHIRNLDRYIGKPNIVKAITYLTLRFAENFNMRGNFDAVQAAILANDLFDVFGYETLEDVVMMYKLARQGRIGDGKDFKLDGQTVMHKWVPTYLELKAIERENRHQTRKDEAKKPMPPSILKEAGKEKVTHPSNNRKGRHYNAMTIILRQKTVEELKQYLKNSNSKSKNYDKAMYELVKDELIFRSKIT